MNRIGDNWEARLRGRLHPPQCPPAGEPANRGEIADLLSADRPPRPAAVLVPLVLHRAAPSLLLTRRAAHLPQHPGQVGFPGGRIEPDDAGVVAAALREAEEEIGLDRTEVRVLGCLDPLLTVTGFQVTPVVATLVPQPGLRADPAEVEEIFEVPLEFLMETSNARSVEADYRGRRRRWTEFDYRGHRIWGATAAIILNLRLHLLDT